MAIWQSFTLKTAFGESQIQNQKQLLNLWIFTIRIIIFLGYNEGYKLILSVNPICLSYYQN